MIIPLYWAEHTQTETVQGKSYTLKRYGWSNTSQEAAQDHAKQRMEEAFSQLKVNGKIHRSDPKVAYNGAEGLPIREEIIERIDDAIITRNSYGALCLNTPDIFIADIDFSHTPPFWIHSAVTLLLIISTVSLGVFLQTSWVYFFGLVITFVISPMISTAIANATVNKPKNLIHKSLSNFNAAIKKNPQANFRIYRTPNGLRAIATHIRMNPRDDKTLALMELLKADPVYQRMCKNQNCFRARISPKPWRIGMQRIHPNGVWPVNEEKQSARKEWVKEYERKSEEFSSCHFLQDIGSGKVGRDIQSVIDFHDEHCQARKVEQFIA
ncbi:hypothetical protein [Marinibactrum halimedae]|uniref:Uncharacterized protein n=1 Tax=Marinibactrum halimedae TaxID=1444977 RepID=A0AA37WL29_9GAMM|nr:hypothetical protein [Marinibactrum halimedae]MCD9458794.1 hypothetical protein [Marinibactrum halimedae]GLS25353.1 hypothetical protein GCM10007877_10670 [Marinibactrum halimedae]